MDLEVLRLNSLFANERRKISNMERIVCLLIGYVFGIFQTGYFYGKTKNIDIRQYGSGNAGTTNTLRTLGWKAGVITFAGDCLKCVFAVLVTRFIFGADHDLLSLLSMYTGAGVVLGHNYPFYMNFKGGKGIAATAGLILTTHPIMFLIVAVIFAGIVLKTRYVSLGSIVIMFVYIIEVFVYGSMGGFGLNPPYLYEVYGVAIFLSAMAIYRHRANIKRLLAGTENKFGVINKVK